MLATSAISDHNRVTRRLREPWALVAGILLLFSVLLPVRVDRLLGSVVQNGTTVPMLHVVTCYGVFTCQEEPLIPRHIFRKKPSGVTHVIGGIVSLGTALLLLLSVSVKTVRKGWLRALAIVWVGVYLVCYLWEDACSLFSLLSSYRTSFTYLCSIGTLCRIGCTVYIFKRAQTPMDIG